MSMKYKIMGSIEEVQKARKELLQKAEAVLQSQSYTESGKTEKIGQMIRPYEEKLSSYAGDIEHLFEKQIAEITAEEQEEQERRNNSLEYQQMLQTKAGILKTAIGGMRDDEITQFVDPFKADPVAVSVFRGILKEFNKNLLSKNAQHHKMPGGTKWVLFECTQGKAAEKLEREKMSVLNLLEKMSFKNYAASTASIVSALHDKAFDAEIRAVLDYVRENIA